MDLDQIIERTDLQEFYKQQGIELQKQKNNDEYYCKCPFCEAEKKMRFAVAGSKKGAWKCYKCEESGNAVTLYSKLHNTANKDSVAAMKKFSGINDDPPPQKKKSNKQNSQNKNQNSQNKTQNNEGAQGSEEIDDPQQEKAGGTITERQKEIYTRFVELTTLLGSHRQDLKDSRGLTDESINALQFCSGGKPAAQTIEQLRKEFSERELHDAGILADVNGILEAETQLVEEKSKDPQGNKIGRIIIPYLDETGRAYLIRPHKLGLPGVLPQLYSRQLLAEKPHEVVLTEGEYKAAVLWQLGIPAVATPGVSAFGGKYFERMVELFREFDVKKITLIFDNEVKDDPAYPNYKKKPEDRHDVEYWCYLLAYQLGREGFSTRIGKLPDEWRVNGKIDFDGAVAAGRTKAELQECVEQAVTPKEFMENLNDEARKIVRRKLARRFSTVPIKREFKKYVALRTKGGEQYEEVISNFVINIKSSFFTADGVIRNIEFENEIGETSDVFPLMPGDMAGVDAFKKFCFSKGNFLFKGSAADLMHVWEVEFMRETGDMVYQPDRIGYIGDGIWLFGRLAFREGKIYKPDEDGIFWIDGKGFKPISLQINARGESVEEAIPTLSDKPIDLQDMSYKFYRTIGGYEAYMGIGWVIASLFSRDIFEKYRCMPILLPHGKRESGKTTFVWWLMNLCGIEQEGAGVAESTQNFIARVLSYYSSLPAWFDEYRNERKVTDKDGFFRSAYDRHVSGKGTATAFQTRGFTVRGSVVLSGEEIPRDNGLFTRCIPLQISEHKRTREWYDWLNSNHRALSYLSYYVLANYNELRPQVMESIAGLKEALLQRGLSDRVAQNWAICAGAFTAVIKQDAEFIRWVEQACQEVKQSAESEHMLNVFLTDLSVLLKDNKVGEDCLRNNMSTVYIWLPGAYGAWATYYRQKTGKEPFDQQSILKYAKQEPYYMGEKKARMGKVSRNKVMALDSSHDEAPESLEEIREQLDNLEE